MLMIKSEELVKGQRVRIDLNKLQDRLPEDLINKLRNEPTGVWMGGYKMVDGNEFGLILEFTDGSSSWFFENELSIDD